jgi:hypothetical protein
MCVMMVSFVILYHEIGLGQKDSVRPELPQVGVTTMRKHFEIPAQGGGRCPRQALSRLGRMSVPIGCHWPLLPYYGTSRRFSRAQAANVCW